MRATSQERWVAADHNSLFSIYFTIIMHQYPKAQGHILIFSICRTLRSLKQHKWKGLSNQVSKSWKSGELLKSHKALRSKAKLFCIRERGWTQLSSCHQKKKSLWKITLSVNRINFQEEAYNFCSSRPAFKTILK